MMSRASLSLILNGGMGDRSGAPVREIPVVNSLTAWSVLYCGSPAMRGAVLAHWLFGKGDVKGMGAPRNL